MIETDRCPHSCEREAHQTQAEPGSVQELPQRRGCFCQILKLPLGEVAREGGERGVEGEGRGRRKEPGIEKLTPYEHLRQEIRAHLSFTSIALYTGSYWDSEARTIKLHQAKVESGARGSIFSLSAAGLV